MLLLLLSENRDRFFSHTSRLEDQDGGYICHAQAKRGFFLQAARGRIQESGMKQHPIVS
jgi:hypothetical protein